MLTCDICAKFKVLAYAETVVIDQMGKIDLCSFHKTKYWEALNLTHSLFTGEIKSDDPGWDGKGGWKARLCAQPNSEQKK